MRKKITNIGIITLLSFFAIFYIITSFTLDKTTDRKNNTIENIEINENNNIKKDEEETRIILDLYQDLRILYGVVNSKFKVDQEDTITINDYIYKKISNFNEETSKVFTENGLKKYVDDLKQYFAYYENNYYLIGSLVTYQTYYFRGDTTNIYILESNDSEINAILYEKWTSNNSNTIATIKVVKTNNKWLVDNVNILSSN